MRWPWIHRASYDWAIKQLGQRDWRIDALESANADLVRQIVLMKREGFVAQPDPNEFIPKPPSVDETDEERALEELHG